MSDFISQIGMNAIQTLSSGIMTPLQREIAYRLNSVTPNIRVDLITIIDNYFRGEATWDDVYRIGKELGFDPNSISLILNTQNAKLSISDYIVLYRRNIIDYETFVKLCYKHGLKDDELYLALKVSEYFPSADDLVRWAVKEVYSPNIREAFALDEGFPEIFQIEAAKLGMSSDMAKNYWAAHWALPSPTQAFDMYQRSIITYEQLQLLLKALDINPFWRDKLIQLAYNPLTRVDVRRMYALGVITDDNDLKRCYQEIGYSPENANRLVQFTKQYESNEFQGITRENLVSSYVDGVIDVNQLQSMLQQIGYSDTVIEYWISYAEYKRTNRIFDEMKQEISQKLFRGEYDYDQCLKELVYAGATEPYVSTIMKQIVREKYYAQVYAPFSTLQKWVVDGIIDVDQFITGMKRLNYAEETITNYVIEYELTAEKQSRKFLSVTQYEQMLKAGIISVEYFTDTLSKMLYSIEDINSRIMLISQGGK